MRQPALPQPATVSEAYLAAILTELQELRKLLENLQPVRAETELVESKKGKR